MTWCVTDHARKGAAKLLAIALAAIMLAAPVASSWHELTVRHVRCAEHGELTHVATSEGVTAASERDFAAGFAADHDLVEGQENATTDAHDHCALGFIVRGRVDVSVVRSLVRYTPPPVVARVVRRPAVNPGRAFVLASAPKTSPPSA
jgi:hypothetical protein